MSKLTIEELAVFCKRKGFVYPNSEIYGGMSGFFDYGPLGVELKNNIKTQWWKAHVQQRQDVVGIDGSIITNPKVWEASGHVENFTDLMLNCVKCGHKERADQLIEDKLKIPMDGVDAKEIGQLIKKHKIKCTRCGSDVKAPQPFNLMFKTNIGPLETKNTAYLRPETAQLIFTNFKLVQENARMKLPFGIAQIGKAFRNEISPRDFLFRCREFEQMELEYFVHPYGINDCPYIKEFAEYSFVVLTSEMQGKKQSPKKMTVKDMLAKKLILPWHAYWLAFEHDWLTKLGVKSDNLRVRQHVKEEKSHYATDTWDLEYAFPFGWKELEGISNRADYDLQQHIKKSGKDMSYFDEAEKAKVVPHVVAEPSLGVDRTFLVFLFDAYEYDKKKENIVLKLHPKLAPIKVAVFPLLSNKKELVKMAKDVYEELKEEFNCLFDSKGSIGKMYSRQDEIGTIVCCTVDFQSLKDDTITLRNRNTTRQIRLKIDKLKEAISKFIYEGTDFNKLGKPIK